MLFNDDCLQVLPFFEENSIDACVTDPPYGLKFMGREWDHGVPGTVFWQEVLRVLKPGAHLLAFGGTRTHHRLMCAIEDAGFEIRDCLGWLYGSGFPKSLNVGNGWGTALKPAWEPIVLARKPLVGTVLANIEAHGTGALNIDGSRVLVGEQPKTSVAPGWDSINASNAKAGYRPSAYARGGVLFEPSPLGRWPANILHDGSDEVLECFPQSAGQLADASSSSSRKNQNTYGAMRRGNGRENELSASSENKGMVGFNMRPGARRGDVGSAARFFYCAKASKADREAGCDVLSKATAGEATGGREEGSAGLNSPRAGAGRTNGAKNFHPTVKPHALMRYLCKLVTPSGGKVLDPFMGSGSTGRAALVEGFEFYGIELDTEYFKIAQARVQ